MFPTELALKGLGHCYISLPPGFLHKNQRLKPGSVIGIRSVQNDDREIFVLWNGQVSSDNKTNLDLSFAEANEFKDEMVVIRTTEQSNTLACSLCRVELIDASDHGIVSEHLSANVLDRCKIVSKNLVIPIWLSEHVKVMAKVSAIEPLGADFVELNQWTEMQFIHDIPALPDQSDGNEVKPIKNEIVFISYSLGLKDQKPEFFPGALLIEGECGSGKTHLLKSIEKDYNSFHCEILNCMQLRGKRPESVKKTLNEILAKCLEKQPSILALDDIDAILAIDTKQHEEKGQEAIYKARLVDTFCQLFKRLERLDDVKTANLALVISCQSLNQLDPRISKPSGRTYLTETIKISEPDLPKRISIIKEILLEHKQINSESIKNEELEHVAKKCNSYMPSDLKRLVERSIMKACARSRSEFSSDPLSIKVEDFTYGLSEYTPANLRSMALEPKSTRRVEDVGGMKQVKEILTKTILLPIRYPHIYERCPQRPQTAVLLYGPPGCGKSLIAEAMSNNEGLNSICIRGPELLSKYIGGSEAAVRNLFKRASLAKPCVIVFDEFESLVPKRGTDSTGVTDRVVNQFLTLIDGVEALTTGVFILATTSRPDMIDPAILRPGRVELHVYCPMPSEDDRLEIIRVLKRHMNFNEFDGQQELVWARRLEKFTGADVQSWLYSAQVKALHEHLELNKSQAVDQEFEIIVSEKHLNQAFEELKPEVLAKNADLEQRYPRDFRKVNREFKAKLTLA